MFQFPSQQIHQPVAAYVACSVACSVLLVLSWLSRHLLFVLFSSVRAMQILICISHILDSEGACTWGDAPDERDLSRLSRSIACLPHGHVFEFSSTKTHGVKEQKQQLSI